MRSPAVALLALTGRASLESFGTLLADAGFEVRESSADALLAAAALDQTGFILLDTELPDQDGLEVCRLLRRRACPVPVILRVPALVEDFRKQAASNTDADAFLWEPCSPEAVLAAARAMLRLARERREYLDSVRQLKELEAKAREAQMDLEQIASQACHDFEEPFRAITTFAELLSESRDAPVSREVRDYLRHAAASAGLFRRLLRGVLSYSLAGRLRPEEFGEVDLRIAASAAIQNLRPIIESSVAAIECDEPLPRVNGDFGALQLLFEQLIGNAVLYRRPGSAPCIRIGATRESAGGWPVRISDNGPGIPEDRREFVFQPFKRLHGRDTPGAGLGLSIARKIIQAHGGGIWIETADPNGARICFELPTPRGTA